MKKLHISAILSVLLVILMPVVVVYAQGGDVPAPNPMDLISQGLNLLLQGLLLVALPLALRALKILIESWLAQAESRIGKERMEQIKVVVRWTVQAAEQLGLVQEIDDKLTWALNEAHRILEEEYNIKVDFQTLRAIIEAMVHEEFNWQRLTTSATGE